jgi:outer membrane protein TolC
VDSTSLSLFDGTPIFQEDKEFNFSEWGPFYGVEFKVAQPLNVGRYRAGKRAAELKVKVSEAEFRKELLAVSLEAQELYWQRVYAQTLFDILKAAKKELDKAQRRLSEKLDDMDPNVKQTDLLELKAGRFTLDKGYAEAATGVRRASLGLAFLLADTAGHRLQLRDSVLLAWPPQIPSLDSLKLTTLRSHPDLARLSNGLAARRELLKVAQGELGPDIFLFGSFKYTKVWSSDREGSGGDPFARDPLNDLSGVAGLGFRLRLNFWQRYQKLRKERLELKKLEAVEVYAVRGLLLKVEDAYEKMLEAKALVTESQKALRAAESWLKGAAIQYDLDPGAASQIISPFKASLTAKRDYFGAVLKYNLAFSLLLHECGWTLSDYFGSLAVRDPEAVKNSESTLSDEE